MSHNSKFPQTTERYWQLQIALNKLDDELHKERTRQQQLEASLRELHTSLKHLFSQKWPKLEVHDE